MAKPTPNFHYPLTLNPRYTNLFDGDDEQAGTQPPGRAFCTCLIPFFNEEVRIKSVLETVQQVNSLAEIICIDDGSSDQSAILVQKHFPKVTLIQLPNNQGKTAAVRAGMELVKTPYVLLLDADLHGLQAREIEQAIEKITTNTKIDMIILRRVRAGINSKVSRGDVLFSGERILRSDDLRQVISSNVEHYQIEIAINHYMLEMDRKVYWMPSSAVNTFKFQKIGLVKGLKRDLEMRAEMMAYQGVGVYVKQMVMFAHQQAP